jgi:diacylglycerol kinase family enzyme
MSGEQFGGPIREAGRDAQVLIAHIDQLIEKVDDLVEKLENEGVEMTLAKVGDGTVMQFVMGEIPECPVAIRLKIGKTA